MTYLKFDGDYYILMERTLPAVLLVVGTLLPPISVFWDFRK